MKILCRSVFLLLSIAMLLSVQPDVYATDTVSYAVEGGNIYFDPSTGTITDCDWAVTAAVIPDKIDGLAVTKIGDNVFLGLNGLVSVVIPDSVIAIGEGAFDSCRKLSSVLIGNSVTSIGEDAFNWCDSLTSIVIPDSVTVIGDYAFYHCEKLNDITIGNSVATIGYQAFYGCSSLTSISIPNSVTHIGYGAFMKCINLKSLTIPSSVKSIDNCAFKYCNNLFDIYYSGTKTQWAELTIGSSNIPLTAATIHCSDGDIVQDLSILQKPVSITGVDFEQGSLWVKFENGNGHDANLIAAFYDANGAMLRVVSEEIMVESVREKIDAVAPKGTVSCKVFLLDEKTWMPICDSFEASIELPPPSVWNILFVVLTNTSLNVYDRDEQKQLDLSYQMTEEEFNAICKSAVDFENDLEDKSEYKLEAAVTVLRCDKVLSDYEKFGLGYYITSAAAKEYLEQQGVDVTNYDHVIFVTTFPDLPHSYFGLGGTFIEGYRGFSFIVYGSGVINPTEFCYNISKTNWPAGLYIHEFLHGIESYGRYKNMEVPSPDGAETYGYQNVDGWRNYYTDIINNRVPFEGGYIGVSPELWKMPPRLEK